MKLVENNKEQGTVFSEREILMTEVNLIVNQFYDSDRKLDRKELEMMCLKAYEKGVDAGTRVYKDVLAEARKSM